MISAMDVLRASGVHFCSLNKVVEIDASDVVKITAGNQLLASYDELKQYQNKKLECSGWQAHHIVETFDLDRLGVAHKFPSRGSQLTVLLPERAHIGRVNSILRVENPVKLSASATDLMPAYKRAYEVVGDYCGGGAGQIQKELIQIVTGTFRLAGVIR